MLTRLRVKNLALVENIAIDFTSGLNIITGETGAGKSILIGALSLLLGERADKSIIRTGADACGAEALFELKDTAAIDSVLDEFGLDVCEDGQLLVRRIIKVSGSGQNLINDNTVTLAVLRRIGELLIDMHGPHEHQSLLSQAAQLELLDAFGHLGDERSVYEKLYRDMNDLRKRRVALEVEDETVADQIDRLTFKVKEIEEAEIKDGEEEEVEREHRQAGNAHRILELSSDVMQTLAESEGSVFNQLVGIRSALDELARLMPEAGAWRDEVGGITSQVQEIANSVSSNLSAVNLNPARLSWLDQRLSTFQKLKRRYGATMEEVCETLRESREKLNDLQFRDERIRELDAEVVAKRRAMMRSGAVLRKRREESSVKLADAVTLELKVLGFERGEFTVELKEREPGLSGIDEIDFGFAPNVGEKMRPLRAIASSGEISRVMLASKAVFARHDKIPILVFDEIDANLGGEMGNRVGAKLEEVAKDHQVICITHLPQVAVHGATHFSVTKYVHDERTFSTIENLSGVRRVSEIARMLGDDQSEASLNHAREMLGGAEDA